MRANLRIAGYVTLLKTTEIITYNFDECLVHLIDRALVEHSIDKEYAFDQDDIGNQSE
jgi:hypothetical protein